MLKTQDQSRRPTTVLQEPCAVSHEETLHVSTTACMGQNTQASMLNSVQETETPITTRVENHQTDSSAAPASTILSTISSMKLQNIMDKMRSCLFGWSWRQMSLFDLTGKDTATAAAPTLHIPCTAIVPVGIQELFFPCSLLEAASSCNQEVEESMAVPPQPSLAELELCLQLTGICDITARLCVVFRPECIVEVDCSILHFKAIAEGMRRIGLPQPIRSTVGTLAIMPSQSSAEQVPATSEARPVDCCNHEMAFDVSLLKDATSYNQVEAEEIVASRPRPSLVDELGFCGITARLCAVLRPECIVVVDCSILHFQAIADGMRRIGLPQPIPSTGSTLAIMASPSSAVQVPATSEAQPVDCDNQEMAFDVSVLEDTTSYNQVEIAAIVAIRPQPCLAELELRLKLSGVCDITARVSVLFRPDGIFQVNFSILRFVAIADDIREVDFQVPIESILSSPEFMALQQVAVTSAVQPVYEMALDHPRQQDLDHHESQAAEGYDPDIATGVPALDHHDVIVNQPEECLEVQKYIDCDNHETPNEAPRWSQIAECIYHDVMEAPCWSKVDESICHDLTVPPRWSQIAECIYHDVMEAPRWSKVDESIYHDLTVPPRWSQITEVVNQNAITAVPTMDDQKARKTETLNLPQDTLDMRLAENQENAVQSFLILPQHSPAELELRLQLPGICNITARVCIVSRPQGIAEVDLTILNFEAIADDVREIDFQLPIESILSSPEFMALQQVAAMSEFQSVGCGSYKMTLATPQRQDYDVRAVEHLSIPALPAADKAEIISIEEICSRLAASFSDHDVIQPASEVAASNDLKGSEIFFGKVIQRHKEVAEKEDSGKHVPISQLRQAELELRLQFPEICDITARVCVVFRPEGTAEVDLTILNVDAIASDIREIDFQLPIQSIFSSPEFMALQQVAAMSEVQSVGCGSYKMTLATPQRQDYDVRAVEHLSTPALPAADKAETVSIEEICSRLAASFSDHDVIQPASEVAASHDLKGSEIFFGKVVQRHKEVAEKEDSGKHVPISQLRPAELELRLQFPDICDITARVSVVFRPEGIAEVDLSILNFDAIASDIREFDFQIPIELILSSPEFMALQQVAVMSEVQSVGCGSYKMALATLQRQDNDSSIPALTAAGGAEITSIEEICSRLAASLSDLEVIQPTSLVSSSELRGSEIFFGKAVQYQNEVTEKVDSGKDVPATSGDYSITSKTTTTYEEDLNELCSRLVSIDTSLLASESTSSNTNEDFAGMEIFFVKTSTSAAKPVEESVAVAPIEYTEESKPLEGVTDENIACIQPTEGVLPATAASVQCDLEQKQEAENATPGLPSEENVVAVPYEEQAPASDSADAVRHATPTVDTRTITHSKNNSLDELVTRGIKQIRKSADVTAERVENVPLEDTIEKRRKRRHADESNELLFKDNEFEETDEEALSTSSLEDEEEEAQRYPSDVRQALLTQTVDLLERGVVLVSDDGSFEAFVNPSSASRIGWALTGDNFARHFQRYDNDVLPQDLKQKVIGRAALVEREHQDRAFGGMTERPIFTLSEIQHYDCNGDYIMEDVSSSNTPVYPFTEIQPTPLHQCYVNPFQAGATPQGLLTSSMHTPFHMMPQYQYTINDIEMIDVDEIYMDIDESMEDMLMECEDQTDCPYCSQISLDLLASLPTKYAISRRAIYSLLDERPLNPEIPSWSLKQGCKKSWFAYNTFSFRPEFDEPSGGLSRRDRVIYSVLDERPLNPVLSPSLSRQSKIKSWFTYNTFSFRDGDLVPVGAKCDCMQTENLFQATRQPANTVPSTVEPWPKLEQLTKPVFPCTPEQNTTASKSPFNTFSFSFGDHNSHEASIFGESKQESVFSFGETEPSVTPTEPRTVVSGVSWKDFSFREEDDPKHVAFFGENTKRLTSSLLQTDKDDSYEEQVGDPSLEPAEEAVNNNTLTFAFEQDEQPAFPVSDDGDSTSSETESQDDEELFDLNDENEEQTIKEIIDAVKLKLKERNANLSQSEEPSSTADESEPVKDNRTSGKEESDGKEGVVDGQKVELQTNPKAKDEVDKTQDSMNVMGQSTTNHVSQDAPSPTEQEASKNIAEPPSKLTITHSKSINKRAEPYPTQAGSGLAGFMRRRVKMIERDRLKSLQISTQVGQVDEDDDSSGSVLVLPENEQQRRVVSLKSLTENPKTPPSSRHDLSITIAPSDEEDRKVVSMKSLTGNQTKTHPLNKHDLSITIAQSDEEDRKVALLKSVTGNQAKTHPSSKHDLSITIAPSDEEDRKVVSLTQDKKPDSPTTASSIAVPPPVQSDVNSSSKKVSLKSLHQTKNKEPDVKGSEMDRLMSRTQRKDSEALSKLTSSQATSDRSVTVSNIKRVSFAQSNRAEQDTSTNTSRLAVSPVEDKRSKVISLRSVIHSKKTEPVSKSSSVQPIEGSEQINNPAPKAGSSQLAFLKSPSLMPKADSMSDSTARLPLVSCDAENTEVVSLNSLSKGRNTEVSSKSTRSVVPTTSSAQKTKVVSFASLTQGTCKNIKTPQASEQISKPLPEEGSSQPAFMKSPTLMPKADSMRNSTPRLPLVSCDAENTKVVSLNSLPKGRNTEVSSKSTHSIVPTTSSAQKSKVVSFASSTQSTCKNIKTSQGLEQICKPSPEEGSSRLASLKSPTLMPKVDSMSNSIPRLPLVSCDAENTEVVSLNPLPKGRNTEVSSKSTHSVVDTSSSVQKTKVVSLTSLTQGPDKKDDQVKNTVASIPQGSSAVEGSKESSDEVKNKVISSKPKTQSKKMGSMKSSSQPVCSKAEASDNKDSVKSKKQSQSTVPLTVDSTPPKSPSAVKVAKSKSEPLNKAAVSSPQVSTDAESRAKTITIMSTNAAGRESTNLSSSSKVDVFSEDAKKVVIEAASHVQLVSETGSARKVILKSTQERKADVLTKSSASTSPVPLEKNTAMPYLKEEPHVSSVAESSCARTVPFKPKLQKEDEVKMSCIEPASCEGNANAVSVSKAFSVAPTDSAKVMTLDSTASQREKQTKSSTSTKTVSCKKNSKVKSISQSKKDDSMSKSSSSEPSRSSEVQKGKLMTFESVTKRVKAVPVSKSRVLCKAENTKASLEPLTPNNVKNNGSANGQTQKHPVSEPSSSGKRETFQNLTSSHKRELDEMLEEDQLSRIERLREFNSRRRKPSTGKPSKADVEPKSVDHSGDSKSNKNSEAYKVVKLVKTDVVQDTSIAKRSLETTKELKPISLAVDVNTVKDVKNDKTAKWIPGRLEKTKPSPSEARVAVTDVPTSSMTFRPGTSQQSNLTSLAAVRADDVSATGSSVVRSSPALPIPNPLPPAEGAEAKPANTVDINVAQSSPSTTPTSTETSPLHDTETVRKDVSNMADSNKPMDTSDKEYLPEPGQSVSSFDLVKEPLCLAGVVAISGENIVNSERIPEPRLSPVPQPAAENETIGKRKLEDMQDEDEEIPSVRKDKPAEEMKKKRRWRTVAKPPENDEKQNKPRRIVRNKFKNG